MKKWIQTTIIESEMPSPYLAEQNVPVSLIKLPDNNCLCRVAGTPGRIAAILADGAITELTDEQARTIIQSKYPDSNLENLDISDPEIDAIAKTNGIDPHIRADIQIPSRGKQLFQNQENYLMAQISTKKGISRSMWDDEAAKSDKYPKGIDIQRDVIDGKGAAHEFVLSRLRTKS